MLRCLDKLRQKIFTDVAECRQRPRKHCTVWKEIINAKL